MAASAKGTKEKRIIKEDKRLRDMFKECPQDAMILYDGLIKRAAYMRVELEDYESDMINGGYVESFSQSDKTDPYDRERPVVRLYNTMNKNYQTIMRQLKDILPESTPLNAGDDLMKFAMSKKS